MRLRTFRMRILIWSWLLIATALAVPFFYLGGAVEEGLLSDSKDSAMTDLNAVHWLLERHGLFADEHQLHDYVTELGRRLDVRITCIDNGRVMADTDVDYARLPLLEDHSTRPEVIEALRIGRGLHVRHSATLGRDMIYAARQMGPIPGLSGGVLRVAIPLSAVQARLSFLTRNFRWIFLLALALSGVAGVFLTRGLTRSISAFSDAARRIGQGQYDMRLRNVPGGEFAPLAESINSMAAGLEKDIRTIEDQKGQLKAMFEGMCEGVLVLDADGRMRTCNTTLAAMYSLSLHSADRTILELTRNLDLERGVAQLVADPGADRKVIVETQLPDGRDVEVSIVPFRDQHGMRKLILVFHDLSQVKKSEAMLQDFVANVSHQLRTPLTSIRGYAETLRDALPDDAAVRDGFLDIILKNAGHMEGIISGMLALARSQQMGLSLSPRPVEAGEIAQQAVLDLAIRAREKGIALAETVSGEERLVLAEEDGLLQVFHNLLENAVKYGREGGRIDVFARDEDGRTVFCVQDDGPGFSRDEAGRLFERFYRVDENKVASDGSAGLGLAICRQIITNFGGEIWTEQPAEGGARFCFGLRTA